MTVEHNKKPLKVLFVHLNFEPGLFCYTAGVSFLPGNPLKVLRLPDFHLIGYPGKFMKVKCNNIRDVCPFVLSQFLMTWFNIMAATCFKTEETDFFFCSSFINLSQQKSAALKRKT